MDIKDNIFDNMDNSNDDLEALEEEYYRSMKALELAELKSATLDEENEMDMDLLKTNEVELVQIKEDMEREIMIEENKIFTEENVLNVSSFRNDSTIINSSLDLSVNEISICESIEVTMLKSDLNDLECAHKKVIIALENLETELSNKIIENESIQAEIKNIRSLRDKLKNEAIETEEDYLILQSEVSVLPKETSQVSIYQELANPLEGIKTELGDWKKKYSEYVTLLAEMETEYKHIESENQALGVYDREDEMQRMQSQANYLEAHKLFVENIEKFIQNFKMFYNDFASLRYLSSGDDMNIIFKMKSFVDSANATKMKLAEDLTYHKQELININNKKSSLESNNQCIVREMKRLNKELNKITLQIEEMNNAIDIKHKITENIDKELQTESKTKTVRFIENDDGKENELKQCQMQEEMEENIEEVKNYILDPKDRLPKQINRIVIHKAKNRKMANIIED